MNELTVRENNNIAISNDLFNRFLDFIDIRETTSSTYTRCIRQFFKWIRENNITNPTRTDIIAYRDYLKGHLKPSTVQTYIISLKQFYKWIEAEGIGKNIATNIKGAKVDRAFKKDYFSKEQIKEIITQDNLSIRDKAIISLAVSGGLRTAEISRANIEDMRNLGDRTVLYLKGKGKDERTDYIEIPKQVEQIIKSYLLTRSDTPPRSPIFTSESNRNTEGRLSTRSISRLIKEAFINAGYDSERLTAHSLRHTTATLNLLNGASLEETQQYLRHADINTTMIYAHHIDRMKNKSSERLAGLLFE
jgi:integrase/recombinase XerD